MSPPEALGVARGVPAGSTRSRTPGPGRLAVTDPVSRTLPYSIVFFLVWTVLLIAWFLLDLPLGPGAPLKLAS
jgi:hypothetical protein